MAARTGQSLDLTPSITAPLLLLITLPAAASIAVAWHRLVLRSEHPGSGIYLRLDSVVVGYMLIFAVIWLPVRSVSLLARLIGGGTAFWLVVVLSFAFLFIMPRVSLALPARALERSDVTFYAAWQATRRNTWRLFWAYMVCFLPTHVIGDVMLRLLPLEADQTTMALADFALKLLAIPLGLIPIGMLSLAYRHFFERSEMN